MFKKKAIAALAIMGIIMLPSSNAHAWDGVISGTISALHVSDAENYAFRVYLQGAPMCAGSTEQWGYVNKSFDNYDVMVSTLTSAYFAGKAVTLFSYLDPQGYCRIAYAAVSN